LRTKKEEEQKNEVGEMEKKQKSKTRKKWLCDAIDRHDY
jgi:hypothetical protein